MDLVTLTLQNTTSFVYCETQHLHSPSGTRTGAEDGSSACQLSCVICENFRCTNAPTQSWHTRLARAQEGWQQQHMYNTEWNSGFGFPRAAGACNNILWISQVVKNNFLTVLNTGVGSVFNFANLGLFSMQTGNSYIRCYLSHRAKGTETLNFPYFQKAVGLKAHLKRDKWSPCRPRDGSSPTPSRQGISHMRKALRSEHRLLQPVCRAREEMLPLRIPTLAEQLPCSPHLL